MIRLGNTVRYADRLWTVNGRSHRTDGTTRLILVDEAAGDSEVAWPGEVEDLGDFSRPVAGGGYTPPEGTIPANDNAAQPAPRPAGGGFDG